MLDLHEKHAKMKRAKIESYEIYDLRGIGMTLYSHIRRYTRELLETPHT